MYVLLAGANIFVFFLLCHWGVFLVYEISGVWHQNEQHVFLIQHLAVQLPWLALWPLWNVANFVAKLWGQRLPERHGAWLGMEAPFVPRKFWRSIIQKPYRHVLNRTLCPAHVEFYTKKTWLLGSKGWQGSSQGIVSFLNFSFWNMSWRNNWRPCNGTWLNAMHAQVRGVFFVDVLYSPQKSYPVQSPMESHARKLDMLLKRLHLLGAPKACLWDLWV